MAKIPIKFKRVAAAFDEAVKWRRPCESSSGSEYWPESGSSLSGLVNSYIEKGDGLDPFDMDMDIDMAHQNEDIHDKDDFESDNDTKRKESLRDLLLECTRDNKKGVKQKIMKEIEIALKLYGQNNNHNHDDIIASTTSGNNGLKRNIMSHLRHKGFDAGLCKSRWEKTGRFPAGTYEYIDVNVGETRYMAEVTLASELDVVRPTTRYSTLLDMIPSIMIIEKPHVLKQIIRLMSTAMKESLKRADLYVAPWRRNGYLQARYFSPYKRTTNKESSDSSATMGHEEGLGKKRSSRVGFEANDLQRVGSYYCRDNGLVSKGGIRVGLLGVALQGK